MAGAQLCGPVRYRRPGHALDAGAEHPPPDVVLCLDHDEPGQTAAKRIQEELQEAGYHSGILLLCIRTGTTIRCRGRPWLALP
ncbi:MAG: toprim domain-containing protein [Dysosmobacter welbionis]